MYLKPNVSNGCGHNPNPITSEVGLTDAEIEHRFFPESKSEDRISFHKENHPRHSIQKSEWAFYCESGKSLREAQEGEEETGLPSCFPFVFSNPLPGPVNLL